MLTFVNFYSLFYIQEILKQNMVLATMIEAKNLNIEFPINTLKTFL